MNLIIDIGNTNTKIAVFEYDNIIEIDIINAENTIKAINKFLCKYKAINKAIISNVSETNNSTLINKISIDNVYCLSDKLKLPFNNMYKSKETLGSDRKALVSAAIKHYPNNNVLIIDAGTCITTDFIDASGNYHGGSISPGINMRYGVLSEKTSNLPKLERKYPLHITGSSTEDSIHSGIINGIVYEIREYISEYKKQYKSINIILTGGDSDFLSKPLKISIFANRNFLLEGLNFILNLNTED